MRKKIRQIPIKGPPTKYLTGTPQHLSRSSKTKFEKLLQLGGAKEHMETKSNVEFWVGSWKRKGH